KVTRNNPSCLALLIDTCFAPIPRRPPIPFTHPFTEARNVMRTWRALTAAAIAAAMTAACGSQAGSLQTSADALKAADTRTIEYSGTGKWFQFGQAPNPTLPWPAFDVSAYTASIDYNAP